MEFNEELIKEIKETKIYGVYKFLTKISRYAESYKRTMIVIFIAGFIDHIMGGNIFLLNYLFLLGITPGIIFVFLAGATHIIAGIKIAQLAKKYSIDEAELKNIIDKNS